MDISVARRLILTSAAFVFSVLALVGYRLFGVAADGPLLALAAALYVAVMVGYQARLGALFFVLHYFVMVASFAGVVTFLFEHVGPARGALELLAGELQHGWSSSFAYRAIALYLATRVPLVLLVVIAASYLFHRRRPDLETVLIGLFAASVVNIPCDFALRDALSTIGTVEFDDTFYAFAFAVGLGSIEFAVLLHLLVTVAVGVFLWRRSVLRVRHETPMRQGCGGVP